MGPGNSGCFQPTCFHRSLVFRTQTVAALFHRVCFCSSKLPTRQSVSQPSFNSMNLQSKGLSSLSFSRCLIYISGPCETSHVTQPSSSTHMVSSRAHAPPFRTIRTAHPYLSLVHLSLFTTTTTTTGAIISPLTASSFLPPSRHRRDSSP